MNTRTDFAVVACEVAVVKLCALLGDLQRRKNRGKKQKTPNVDRAITYFGMQIRIDHVLIRKRVG